MSDAKPKRIQRKRTKGWTMPSNTVYVGRPTKWGNPYKSKWADVVRLYRDDLESGISKEAVIIMASLEELRGKDLACWCSLDKPCHADVLLEKLNE